MIHNIPDMCHQVVNESEFKSYGSGGANIQTHNLPMNTLVFVNKSVGSTAHTSFVYPVVHGDLTLTMKNRVAGLAFSSQELAKKKSQMVQARVIQQQVQRLQETFTENEHLTAVVAGTEAMQNLGLTQALKGEMERNKFLLRQAHAQGVIPSMLELESRAKRSRGEAHEESPATQE